MSIKRTAKFTWMFWHRWIGLVACVGMVLWGLSGASHPIMTRLQPTPKQFMPPLQAVDFSYSQALPQVLLQAGIQHFQHISLAQIEGQSYYRVSLDAMREAHYYSVKDGQLAKGLEQKHAIALACYYTGLPASKVLAVRRLSQFEQDYHPVNRLLPVWQVRLDQPDGLRAYVDTEQSRLATLVDNRRAILTQLFQWGHNWSFLQACSRLQLAVATTVLGLILASAVTGWVLFIRQRKTAPYRIRRGSLRWWHRTTGPWISSGIFLLASSGLFHLWMSDMQQHRPAIISSHTSNSVALSTVVWQHVVQQPLQKLDVYGHDNHLFWQVIPASPHSAMPAAQVGALRQHSHHPAAPVSASLPILYQSEADHLTTLDGERYSRLWMKDLSGLDASKIDGVRWIDRFANEYGFIFKRLPVLQVHTNAANGQRWYVEPATGLVAASINNIDGLEGFVFAYLHKWSFSSLAKDVRDAFAIIAALFIASLGVLGAVLFWRM